MTKIHCLNKIAKIGLDNFSSEYKLTDNIEEAQGILVRSGDMHKMEFSDNLLAIARAGAGVNNIPLDRCAEDGIVVFNTPGANANAVKELVVAGMLMASRDITGGIKWVAENKENPDLAKAVEANKSQFAGNEIQGKKLGVIGLGAIGAKVANVAVHMGMDVYGYDPYISVDAAWMLSRSIHHIENLDDIFRECDYITLHVPLLDASKGFVNKESIGIMKDGVVILNFSRDSLVNDSDMAEALSSGKVKRYVTDFPNPDIAGADGVIAIPHLGASTAESEDNCAVMAVNELKDFIENGNIKNSVNYPACDMGRCTQAGRIAVMHLNVPNMIGQITGVMAGNGVNISDMTNKSRNKTAYTLLDLDREVTSDMVDAIEKIDGVIRVRVIK